jgi:large conductance mechanosensitive channel protein
MKKFISEFKAFIKKGNIMDMAIGVIIGAAFGKIVTSLVKDLIMPLISACFGGKSVADWKWIIKEATYDANGVVLTAESSLNYGNFIQTVIDFLIIAMVVFLILKAVMAIKNVAEEAVDGLKKMGDKGTEEVQTETSPVEEAAPVVEAKPTQTEELLTEIRDLLKQKAE